METVVLVPVLLRPRNVLPLLSSLKLAAALDSYRVLFIADEDDAGEIQAIERTASDYITVPTGTNYAAKINAGVEASDEPLIFQAADDLHFRRGWLERAQGYLSAGVEVVGTNDLCNRRVMCGEHSTHSLFTRRYVEEEGTIDEPGKIFHEGYPHEFCDDEAIQTAINRGVYAHAFDSLVEHLHPMVGKAREDSVYKLGRARTREGRKLFMARRRMWLPR